MKRYENEDNFRERLHTVEITLQSGEYKGTVKQEVGGNCFGLSVLGCFDPDCMDEEETFVENNCQLEILEDEYFKCVLRSEDGEECEIEDELRYLGNYVVKLEIVDCKII